MTSGRATPEATPWCLRLVPPQIVDVLVGVSVTEEWSQLRARCESRVDTLLQAIGGMPNPWDVDDFCDRLEAHLGRMIELVPVTWTVGESTGAWQRREDFELIAFAENTSPVHQDQIILHELAHLLCAHRGRCVLSVQEAHELAPDLRAAAFTHLLDRVSVTAEEHEAEMIATLILSRVARQPRRTRGGPARLDASTSAALSRVTAAFDEL